MKQQLDVAAAHTTTASAETLASNIRQQQQQPSVRVSREPLVFSACGASEGRADRLLWWREGRRLLHEQRNNNHHHRIQQQVESVAANHLDAIGCDPRLPYRAKTSLLDWPALSLLLASLSQSAMATALARGVGLPIELQQQQLQQQEFMLRNKEDVALLHSHSPTSPVVAGRPPPVVGQEAVAFELDLEDPLVVQYTASDITNTCHCSQTIETRMALGRVVGDLSRVLVEDTKETREGVNAATFTTVNKNKKKLEKHQALLQLSESDTLLIGGDDVSCVEPVAAATCCFCRAESVDGTAAGGCCRRLHCVTLASVEAGDPSTSKPILKCTKTRGVLENSILLANPANEVEAEEVGKHLAVSGVTQQAPRQMSIEPKEPHVTEATRSSSSSVEPSAEASTGAGSDRLSDLQESNPYSSSLSPVNFNNCNREPKQSGPARGYLFTAIIYTPVSSLLVSLANLLLTLIGLRDQPKKTSRSVNVENCVGRWRPSAGLEKLNPLVSLPLVRPSRWLTQKSPTNTKIEREVELEVAAASGRDEHGTETKRMVAGTSEAQVGVDSSSSNGGGTNSKSIGQPQVKGEEVDANRTTNAATASASADAKTTTELPARIKISDDKRAEFVLQAERLSELLLREALERATSQPTSLAGQSANQNNYQQHNQTLPETLNSYQTNNSQPELLTNEQTNSNESGLKQQQQQEIEEFIGNSVEMPAMDGNNLSMEQQQVAIQVVDSFASLAKIDDNNKSTLNVEDSPQVNENLTQEETSVLIETFADSNAKICSSELLAEGGDIGKGKVAANVVDVEKDERKVKDDDEISEQRNEHQQPHAIATGLKVVDGTGSNGMQEKQNEEEEVESEQETHETVHQQNQAPPSEFDYHEELERATQRELLASRMSATSVERLNEETEKVQLEIEEMLAGIDAEAKAEVNSSEINSPIQASPPTGHHDYLSLSSSILEQAEVGEKRDQLEPNQEVEEVGENIKQSMNGDHSKLGQVGKIEEPEAEKSEAHSTSSSSSSASNSCNDSSQPEIEHVETESGSSGGDDDYCTTPASGTTLRQLRLMAREDVAQVCCDERARKSMELARRMFEQTGGDKASGCEQQNQLHKRGGSLSSSSSNKHSEEDYSDGGGSSSGAPRLDEKRIDELGTSSGLEDFGTIKLVRRSGSSASSTHNNIRRTLVCSVSPTSQLGGSSLELNINSNGGANQLGDPLNCDEPASIYPIDCEEIDQCRAAFRENRRLIEEHQVRAIAQARLEAEAPANCGQVSSMIPGSDMATADEREQQKQQPETTSRALLVKKKCCDLSQRHPNCSRCEKRVYPVDKMELDFTRTKLNIHKNCFKCQVCSSLLRLETYAAVNAKLYCPAHIKSVAPGVR